MRLFQRHSAFMQETRLRITIGALLILLIGLVVALVAMARTPPRPFPTPDLGQIHTAAVATYVSLETAEAPTATFTPISRPTLAPASATALSGTPSCFGLRFVRDVTIPDNTNMAPAEVFTKTWQVENSGTCAWEPGFQVVLIGGTAMGGSPFRVAQKFGPGGSIQVSIKMVAPPNQTGVVQGTWKMSDTNGLQFGDYLSVVIVVSRPTGEPALSVTATP